jgi:hypothetical protein
MEEIEAVVRSIHPERLAWCKETLGKLTNEWTQIGSRKFRRYELRHLVSLQVQANFGAYAYTVEITEAEAIALITNNATVRSSSAGSGKRRNVRVVVGGR